MKLKSIRFLSCFLCFAILPAYADKVAIIGGGAAGLATAWLIEENHDVTLYEAKDKLGGHVDSIPITVNGHHTVIEAGIEFFNDLYYPHMMNLLHYLNIPLHAYTFVSTFYNTDGSGLIILPPYHDHTVEWKSLTPDNLVREAQLALVIGKSKALVENHDTSITTQQFLDSLDITKSFKTTYLYPMLAALWGVTPETVQALSAFDTMHYLVEGSEIPNYQWYEVVGGLQVYINAEANSLKSTQIKLNDKVTQITKVNGKYLITDINGTTQAYDQIVLATDASVASSLLSGMPETAGLSSLLGRIQYYDTVIAIHGDKRFMPPNPEDWRQANIRYDGKNAELTTYKSWLSDTPIFRSWLTYDVRPPGDKGGPMPNPLYALIKYRHPITDHNYFEVQKAIEPLQGNDGIWFAGMWTFDNDSHESAIVSAMKIAEKISPNTARLKILEGSS